MRYLVLIYDEESANPSPEPPDPAIWGQVMGDYNAYSQMLRDRGAYVAGEALQPVTTATTVRIRDGQTMTTDGPFAETKEALGGFYMIEAKDLDEALELGAACPGAQVGSSRCARSWSCRAHDPIGTSAAGLTPDAAHALVDRLFREESGRAVATLIRVLGDFDLAEEAVQDAFTKALEVWPAQGVPRNPGSVDHDHGPQPGHRPDPPSPAARREDRRSCAGRPRSMRRRVETVRTRR